MKAFDEKTRIDIASIINEHDASDYDRSIVRKGYYHFYYLSSLRHALLEWYPFKPGGVVLEIGATYGPLTGLYLKMFDRVDALEGDSEACAGLRTRFTDDRLRIFCTDIAGYDTTEKYDYVFFVDSKSLYTEPIEDLIRRIRSLMKDSATAIIGFRNNGGIKYSCGAIDEYVTEPFRTDKLPNKDDLISVVKSLFDKVEIYYPFPDHVYTQAVYSESNMPTESFRDRVMPFDPFDSPLIKMETEEYELAIQRGEIADKSNFVLLFASNDSTKKKRVARAVLSCDRGDRSYKTVFFEDETVIKTPIKEIGKAYLKESFDNLEYLKGRGLITVDQIIRNGAIEMPWVKEKSILALLSEYADLGSRDQIILCFKEMYANILASSDADSSNYDCDKWTLSIEQAVPILRYGFTDLIPYNAFMTDKGIMYYDQEFMVEYCPAKYILFRAIHYTYIHLNQLDNVIKKDDMFGLFGIDQEMQKAFTRVEDSFVSDNRNWNLYGQLYNWAYGITRERIEANRKSTFEKTAP